MATYGYLKTQSGGTLLLAQGGLLQVQNSAAVIAPATMPVDTVSFARTVVAMPAPYLAHAIPFSHALAISANTAARTVSRPRLGVRTTFDTFTMGLAGFYPTTGMVSGVGGYSPAFVTQVGVEMVVSKDPRIRFTQVGVEFANRLTPEARMSEIGAEFIERRTARLHATEVGVELAIARSARARVTEFGVEVALRRVYPLQISPTNPRTVAGRSVQFSAQRINSDGSPITGGKFGFTDDAPGTIDSNGIFEANAPGTFTVTATDLGDA